MSRHIFSTLIFCLWTIALHADVNITARAPQQVVMGDQFRLQYVISGSTNLDDIQLSSITGFEVIAGPYTSTQSSVQIINGKTTQSSSVTVTYVLIPTIEGAHTIAAATATVSGKQIRSNSLTIEVLPSDKTQNPTKQNPTTSQNGNNSLPFSQGNSAVGDGKDLFITVTANKQRVYEQEAVLLTYKVYTLVNLVQLSGKMPELNGCHQQEIDLPQQKSLKLEHYNGRNYRTCVWSQYVIFPQQTGKVTIPAIPFEGIVQQTVKTMDPFETFFGGGGMVREVKRTITAPAVELQVDALPTPKPANFSGAVGQFTLSSSLTPNNLKANEAITLRLVLSGTGNMKLIKTPTVDFPKDFETYSPKVTDKTKVGAQGASGNKVYDYIAVPRHGGEYSVPAVEFCYFDPSAKHYKTLKGEEYTVSVEKSSGSPSQNYTAIQQEDLELLAEDIRFIKRGETHPIDVDSGLFASSEYYAAYGIALVLFGAFVIVFRRQIAANADVARRRVKKAGKAANKRLKTARKLLKEHRQNEFYDETLKALWGYVADKLNMDVAELNRDNVAGRLLANGVQQDVVDGFLAVLSDCEFARYAPGDLDKNMDKIYVQAADVINKIR